jgi:hypothetical protein
MSFESRSYPTGFVSLELVAAEDTLAQLGAACDVAVLAASNHEVSSIALTASASVGIGIITSCSALSLLGTMLSGLFLGLKVGVLGSIVNTDGMVLTIQQQVAEYVTVRVLFLAIVIPYMPSYLGFVAVSTFGTAINLTNEVFIHGIINQKVTNQH